MSSQADPRARAAPAGALIGEIRSLARPAVPIALAGMINLSMSITSAMLMAALDPRALTAGVVIGDIFSIVLQFATGALGAAAAPIAGAVAAGDMARAGRAAAAGVRLALLLALGGAGLIALSPAILSAAGIALPLPDMAADYALFTAGTYAAMTFVALARTVYPAFGAGRAVPAVMLAAVPLNLVASLVLIHGGLGIPGLGLAGAGAASLTVAVAIAAALLAGARSVRAIREAEVWRHAFRAPAGALSPAFLRTAVLTGANALCETGVYLSSTVVVAFVMIEAVPAHVLVFRALAITYVVGSGFAQAVTLVLARQRALARDLALPVRAATIVMAGLAAAFSAAMLALPGASAIVGLDPALTAPLAPWAAVAVAALAAAVVPYGILRAHDDLAIPSLISFAGYWGVGFTTIALGSGPLGLGVVGVWAGLALGTTATATGLWLHLLRRRRSGAALADRLSAFPL